MSKPILLRPVCSNTLVYYAHTSSSCFVESCKILSSMLSVKHAGVNKYYKKRDIDAKFRTKYTSYSDREVWTTSVDLDQTFVTGPAVLDISTGSYHCSWCWCHVAAAERLPVFHHIANYIPFPLGSLGPLWYL